MDAAKDSSGAKLLGLEAALRAAPHAYRVALPENMESFLSRLTDGKPMLPQRSAEN